MHWKNFTCGGTFNQPVLGDVFNGGIAISLPISRGGADICNITFFEVKGVKNVILHYAGFLLKL